MIALAGLAFGLGLSTEFWILDWRNWETLSNGGQIVDTECDECCSGPMTGAMAGEERLAMDRNLEYRRSSGRTGLSHGSSQAAKIKYGAGESEEEQPEGATAGVVRAGLTRMLTRGIETMQIMDLRASV